MAKANEYKWNLDNIREGLELFFRQNNRYPTAHEIDESLDLPSSRQIARRFGGLIELRKVLGLSGPTDFTKGEYSSARAIRVNYRANEKEKFVYDYLIGIFGVPFVHREYFFSDDRRARTDFFVHCLDGNFSVDVFYPKDRFNLLGCINSKMKTYGNELMLQYPVIFLMMNDKISERTISELVENKKNKLHNYQTIMTFKQFEVFVKTKKPYGVK